MPKIRTTHTAISDALEQFSSILSHYPERIFGNGLTWNAQNFALHAFSFPVDFVTGVRLSGSQAGNPTMWRCSLDFLVEES
jgi:hypothetical protein